MKGKLDMARRRIGGLGFWEYRILWLNLSLNILILVEVEGKSDLTGKWRASMEVEEKEREKLRRERKGGI